MAKRYDKKHRLLKTGETERADGYYVYRWTGQDGKRRSVTAGTLEDLRRKEEEIQKDISDGIRMDARTVTVNDLFQLWKQLKRGIKDNTLQNYCYMYTQFVAEDIGTMPVGKLKRSDVKRFYNKMAEDRGLKIATIDNIHSVLHQVLQMAVEDSYVRTNVSDNLLKELKQTYHAKEKRKEALTMPEQELFLDFVYFGFFWKLKGIFWKSVIPFVYRGRNRNVENHVENVKNCGFYSPLFHIRQVLSRSGQKLFVELSIRLIQKISGFLLSKPHRIWQKISM